MIRDRFEGNYMAKIMSFVVSIFILVPIVAPTLGKIYARQLRMEIYFLQSVDLWCSYLNLVVEKTTRNLASCIQEKFSSVILSTVQKNLSDTDLQ